jgi:uncharacterized protein (DUF433 family)
MTAVRAPIVLDEKGRAWITGTTTKVSEVVLNQEQGNYSIAELHEGMPHLSLRQIEDALSYYRTNRDKVEREISESLELSERLRKEMGQSPAGLKARALRDSK